MSWTATIDLDADKPLVGTVEAVHNAGEADELRFRVRTKLTADGIALVCRRAHQALANHQQAQQSQATLTAAVIAALNAPLPAPAPEPDPPPPEPAPEPDPPPAEPEAEPEPPPAEPEPEPEPTAEPDPTTEN